MTLVDIHGSCLSRNIFNFNKNTNITVNQYFSRNNIVSSMMPPADISTSREELLFFDSEYSHRCLRYAIEKKAVPLLKASIAEFLVVDFFDFCQPVAAYKNTTFSTYDYSFFNTAAYKNEPEKFKEVNFFELPNWLWYGYVDLYWQLMIEKFGDRIVLVRLNCCNKYISKDGIVKPTPSNLLKYGTPKYNKQLHELEEYIIDKYNPYVIDVSKYFIADENYNPDVSPVHFEENYGLSSWQLMQTIILNKPKQKYYDTLTPRVVADLLNRPIDDQNYKIIWSESEHFFVACDLLDDISSQSEHLGIIKNRKWLASLYSKADNIFSKPYLEITEKLSLINQFIDDLKHPETENDFTREYVQKLKEKQYYLNQPVEQLLENFLNALDTGDLKWVQMLNCIGILLPANEDVIYYQLEYNKAIGEKNMVTKLKQRLGLMES
ncbi:hypothetical protein SD70_12160 [Gordoniibacillus kamchatkensis]|uniref:Uncharacterized protein n=2 Tax=Gordoniibacillus kamchatkensis TaxID=1590651 RepID=A0ABR5AI14_9BACL|nr:hypothetical protein SD70_12160 [Paenibacillus sp. VKM B-2647]